LIMMVDIYCTSVWWTVIGRTKSIRWSGDNLRESSKKLISVRHSTLRLQKLHARGPNQQECQPPVIPVNSKLPCVFPAKSPMCFVSLYNRLLGRQRFLYLKEETKEGISVNCLIFLLYFPDTYITFHYTCIQHLYNDCFMYSN